MERCGPRAAGKRTSPYDPDGTWWINNAGAVHSGGEVVLVDTCATARRTRLFLDALDAATAGARARVTPMIAMGSLPGALRSLDWPAAFEPAGTTSSSATPR